MIINFFLLITLQEAHDQTRGWFYTLHVISTLVFGSNSYKNVISNGLVLDKNGQKMSKRLGNAVDPFETLDKYGFDATRWYMISNSNPWDNLRFDISGIEEVRRKFLVHFTIFIRFIVCMQILMDLKTMKKILITKTDLSLIDG